MRSFSAAETLSAQHEPLSDLCPPLDRIGSGQDNRGRVPMRTWTPQPAQAHAHHAQFLYSPKYRGEARVLRAYILREVEVAHDAHGDSEGELPRISALRVPFADPFGNLLVVRSSSAASQTSGGSRLASRSLLIAHHLDAATTASTPQQAR